METLFAYLAKNGSTIMEAPVAFGLGVAIVSGLVWAAISWGYARKIESLDSRISLKDDQLKDYKEKLSGASPDEAKARLDALEIQLKALSPRRLTNDDKAIIAKVLAGTKGLIYITQDVAAADAKALAADFAVTFQTVGWDVNLPMVLGPSNVPPTGLGLRVRDPSALTPIENSVRSALIATGIEFDVQGGIQQPPYTPVSIQMQAGYQQAPGPDVELFLTARAI